jgi:hypothetical protein
MAFAASTMPAALRHHDRIMQDAAAWSRGLDHAMMRLASMVNLAQVGALAMDATSGTLLAIDPHQLNGALPMIVSNEAGRGFAAETGLLWR